MFSKVWPGGKKEESSSQDDQSLTTVLGTHEDKASFLLLIAKCTDSMRNKLEATFDPDETGAPPQTVASEGKEDATSAPGEVGAEEEAPPLPPRGDEAEKPPQIPPRGNQQTLPNELQDTQVHMKKDDADSQEQHKAGVEEAETFEKQAKKEQNEAAKKAKAEVNAKEMARKEHDQRVKELNSPQMQQLKNSALEYFDNWRARVMERVGEAINQTGEPEAKEEASSGSSHSQKKSVEKIVQDETANKAMAKHFPAEETPLAKLEEAKRVLILHSVLLLLLSLEHYSSESRILLLEMASSLHLPLDVLTQDETKVAQGLLEAAKNNMNADEETKKKAHENTVSRRWKVGLGAAAGATLIGVTGGLAAPFLAAGIGTVMGGLGLGATATATYLGAIAGSAPLVGALFGAYGGRMAGQMVDSYAKEVSDFAFIPTAKPSAFHSAEAARRLRVGIGISGWLNEPADVVKPWHVLGKDAIEGFALRWEMEALLSLGSAMSTYIKSAAWSLAKKEIIQHTVFAALSAGLWPLGIAKVARVVDNPYSVAKSRSDKAGRVLADALINKVQGERPVTLIGYSLGARLIYSCLEELSKREAFGLVESAVFVGATVPADSVNWRRVRSVVAGRVVNVYNPNDYLLAFLYRSGSLQYGVAGLQAIDGVSNIENVDVSDMVDGHTKYRFLTGRILKKIGFEDIDESAVQAEEKKMHQEEDKEESERKQKEAEAKAEGKDPEKEAKEMEEEVEQNKRAKTMEWMSDKMSSVKMPTLGGKGEKKPEEKMTEEEKLQHAG
ncbi:MAG: hypothetical protein M1831_001440 [Alyxoria varia]|nr:MAG: hypothetical protein M1831_001440 [Alyxoria varia]